VDRTWPKILNKIAVNIHHVAVYKNNEISNRPAAVS